MTAARPPVIVTRAEPGASETAARLEAAGYRVIKSPMLRIEVIDPAPALPDMSDLVFTSANGVQAYAALTDARSAPAWCVGPATAAAARAAGFAHIIESDGDAQALARRILASPDAASRQFLHIANEDAAGDLVKTLRAGGLTAAFMALYRTLPAEALSAEVQAALKSGPAIVLIHSSKGARAFRAAAETAPLHDAVAVAISQAAGAPLDGLGLRAQAEAATPNEDALMAALDRSVRTLGKGPASVPESEAMKDDPDPFDSDEDAAAKADPLRSEPIDAHFEPAADVPARRAGPGWTGLAAASILAAITGGGIALIADRFTGSAPESLARDIKSLRTEREDLSLEVAALAEEQAAMKTALGGADLTALLAELDRASRRLDEALISGTGPKSLTALDARLAAIERADTSGPVTNRDVSRALASLTARIEAAETALARTREDGRALDTLAVRLTQAEATLEMLRASPPPTGAIAFEPAARSERERDPRAEVRRAADLTEAALTLAAIERAGQSGAAFEEDYRTLRVVRPASEHVRALGQVATLGAPPAALLKREYVKAERAARRALPKNDDSGYGWLKAIFGDAVRIQTKGGAESALQSLDTARDAVKRGEFESALTALAALPPEASAAMSEWRAAAQRRVLLDEALIGLRAELERAGDEDE